MLARLGSRYFSNDFFPPFFLLPFSDVLTPGVVCISTKVNYPFAEELTPSVKTL